MLIIKLSDLHSYIWPLANCKYKQSLYVIRITELVHIIIVTNSNRFQIKVDNDMICITDQLQQYNKLLSQNYA